MSHGVTKHKHLDFIIDTALSLSAIYPGEIEQGEDFGEILERLNGVLDLGKGWSIVDFDAGSFKGDKRTIKNSIPDQEQWQDIYNRYFLLFQGRVVGLLIDQAELSDFGDPMELAIAAWDKDILEKAKKDLGIRGEVESNGTLISWG